MRPNVFEYWWQIESTAIEERAARAAALRDRQLSAPSPRPGRARQLLERFADRWRIVTVTDTDENRG